MARTGGFVLKTLHPSALVLGILLFVAWSLISCGSSKPSSHLPCPASNPVSSSNILASIVDPLIAQEMQAQSLVGVSVAIAKNGTILYTQGYGYANLNTCQPVQAAMQFQIGSLTKQFTAAAVLQLLNAGKLNIDNSLASYLPNYSFDTRITLRMLLTQTSGLQDYLNFPASNSWISGVSEATVLTQIAQAPLVFVPGSFFQYSNSNYFVLGAVIEAVSSQTYADYMSTNIFQPLGLNNTSYQQPADIALPYMQGSQPGIIPDPSLFFSAGALWSNVQDLATWNAALRTGKVIPSSLFAIMVTPSGTPNYPQGGPSDYAMGVVADTYAGHTAVWHNGETYSYTSFNEMFLDDGFSEIVLTNTTVQEDTPLFNLGQQLIQAICTTSATAGDC